jgi:uncharacterized protein (DUF1684 family)
MRFRSALLVLLFGCSVVLHGTDVTSPDYQKDYSQWKAELTDDLKKNWLTAVGLFWLKDGINRVGGDQNDEIPLPEGKVPPQVGKVEFHGGKAVFTALPGAKVLSEGKTIDSIELKPDTSGRATTLNVGDIRLLMIQRKDRYAIRVRDPHSKFLDAFKGLDFFPPSQAYVVTAKFVPYDKPRKIAIPTVLGQDADGESPGYVEFVLNGEKQHLQILSQSEDEIFFVLKDKTSGKQTYPAGRFLYAPIPKEGKVELDFNRAYSPPCAWTPYATCPLPPKENYMTVAIEAGERFHGH